MIRNSPVFSRLQEGKNVYGLLNSLPSPLLCEMLAFAGYDFVILDLEHLLRCEEDIMHCVRACEAAGISPWLRLPQVDEKLIGRALDAGIEAIVLSRTESAAQVQRAIKAAFFPPKGKRGITGGRITGFGRLSLPEYIDLANHQNPIIPMIESAAGVEALGEILQLPGVGMIMERDQPIKLQTATAIVAEAFECPGKDWRLCHAAKNKVAMREHMQRLGLPGPWFQVLLATSKLPTDAPWLRTNVTC